MLSDWRKYRYLRWGMLLLLAFFMVAATADAVVCQKMTDQNGNCLLPCLCCHVVGAVHASPIIHIECATSYFQLPITIAPVIMVSTFFIHLAPNQLPAKISLNQIRLPYSGNGYWE